MYEMEGDELKSLQKSSIQFKSQNGIKNAASLSYLRRISGGGWMQK